MTARISDQLLAAREAVALSRSELGHRIGVSDETIRRWENGDYTPRSRQLARRIDRELGTTIEAALFGSVTVPDAMLSIDVEDMARVRSELARLSQELADLRAVLGAGRSPGSGGPARRGSRPLVTTL